MANLLDWGNVDGACTQIQQSLRLSSKREAFTLLCISNTLKIDFDEARGCVTDGGNDRGIDGVYLDERQGRRVIHLFQMKYHTNFSPNVRNFPSTEIDKILSFLNDCFDQAKSLLNTCNPLLQQKVNDIWDFVQAGHSQVEVHLCSNGGRLQDDQRSRFEASITRFKTCTLKEVDLDSLSDDLSHQVGVEREISLHVVEEQAFERTDGSVRALIGTVRADDLIAALTDPSNPTQLDTHLFEENVRVYLGEQNEINRRIFDTAISDEAGLFWYYNNGITIVCERFSYQSSYRNAPLRLRNPQVVNGGQTSHALFQASKANFASLKKIRLLVRVIETQDKSFYAKVAEATNSQTPIRSRDLRSNDPTLLRLEASLLARGWYLDRKRDQHSAVAETVRIDALKLGQIWLAYIRGEPDKAKTASDRIFGEYFPLVFDPLEMDAERVVVVWKLYSLLEEMRRKELSKSRQITRSRHSQASESSWMIEGLYHFAYAVRKVAEYRNIDLYDFDHVQPLIRVAQEQILNFVRDQPRVSFYRLFRTAATKQSLFDATMEDKQLRLFPN